MNNCEHKGQGIYSRGNIWFCSGCNQNVPAPEMPESVRKNVEDWNNLSLEEYYRKYNLPWNGVEKLRFSKSLRGFWYRLFN